jgi:hypothetical protein
VSNIFICIAIKWLASANFYLHRDKMAGFAGFAGFSKFLFGLFSYNKMAGALSRSRALALSRSRALQILLKLPRLYL